MIQQRPNFRQVLVIIIFVVAVLTVKYRGLYWGPPLFESGDYAANALQINHAKFFAEIYGNYSRWGFNHPGPAFFYCYAVGDYLFHDFLPVFPSPHQAHIFIGLLVQTLFLGIALGTFSQFARSWLFTGFLTLWAAGQFSVVPDILMGIWPPYVLIMPLLAFVASAAAVASGHKSYLPWLCLSAGFLAHGHVAQPLFILPIATIAFSAYLRGRRPNLQPGNDRLEWLVSGLLLLIFLAPIMLDFLKGRESNLVLIINHLKTHARESKSLGQAIGYFIYFLLYKSDPETIIDSSTYSLLLLIRQNIQVLLLWAVVVLLPSFLLLRKPSLVANSSSGERYFQWLTILGGVALLMTIQWGRMQDGSMYAFNGFFNYALIFIAALPFLLVVARAVEPFLPGLAVLLINCGCLLVLILVPGQPIKSVQESVPLLSKKTKELLASCEQRPIFLQLERHEVWPRAVAVALTLERERVPFLVAPEWGFLFGRRYVSPASLGDLTRQGITIWQIGGGTENSAVEITVLPTAKMVRERLE